MKSNMAAERNIPYPMKLQKDLRWVWQNKDLYLLLMPAVAYIIIFKYVPIYGIVIAFKDFNPFKGIMGSPWVGFSHFAEFFNSFQFMRTLTNTLLLSMLELIINFPVPIILALLLNQLFSRRYSRFIQVVLYSPHFISVVALVGMMMAFLSPSSGIVNHIIELLGGEPINFFGASEYFRGMYILSGVWKNMGWNAVIYIAVLSGVSVDMHEAAVVDGASKLKRIVYIDLPIIMPTIVIMLILAVGRIMSVGFEKAYLMQNNLNISVSEIIATYVYKIGLQEARYDYATAIGLFNNVINLVLILTVNRIASKVNESSLW